MTLGLGVTGLVAYAAFTLGTVNVGNGRLALTDFGHAIYASPLRWLIVLSPLALVFWLSARINSMSVSTARNAFIAFAALIGLSMSALLVVYTGASIGRAFYAGRGRLREPQPVWLRHFAQPLCDGVVHDDGRYRPRRRGLAEYVLTQHRLAVRHLAACGGDLRRPDRSGYAGDQADVLQRRQLRDGPQSEIHRALRLYLDFIDMFQAILMLTGSQRNS